MHKRSLGIFVASVLLVCGFAAFTFAHDGGGDDEGNHGILHLQQSIVLTATTNAPSGATGKAELIGECAKGTNASVLLVRTAGLTDGTYTVSVTDDTGTNTFALGTFDVAAPTNETGGCRHPILPIFPIHRICPVTPALSNLFGCVCAFSNGFDFTAWTNSLCHIVPTNAFDVAICTNFAGLWTNWFGTCTISNRPPHHGTNGVEATGGSFILPATLDATNVASVSVADSNSVVDLVGDFTNATNTVSCAFDEECGITPGTNWPGIHGSATITFAAVHGREHGKFLLTAQGAPAGQKYALFVNGTATGKARSDKLGGVTINNLHQKDLSAVKTVVLTDVNHNVVLSANF